MDLLGDLVEDDCTSESIIFKKDEVIEFIGVDNKHDQAKGHIFIKAKVQTGDHAGKDYTIFLAGGDSEMARKQRAMLFFKSGFWTPEEIKNKDLKLSRLTGRKFQAKASAAKKVQDKTYQNMFNIRDMGEVSTESEPAADPANKTNF